MAREMLLAGVDPEELKPTPKIEPPKTPKGKWENFWYHHKWATIISLFAAFALTVLIVQGARVNRPDYTVMLVTDKSYDDLHLSAMEASLEGYGNDLDGDGEVEVEIVSISLGNQATFSNNTQKMHVHLWAGDVVFFMWEPHHYEQMTEGLKNSVEEEYRFIQPPAVESDGLRPDGTWDWEKEPRRKEGLLADFPEHLYFGVRYAEGTAHKSGDKCRECMQLLENYIADRPTAAAKK